LKRVDLVKCLTGTREAPVLEQLFLVQLGPSEYEPQLATAERGLDRLQCVDPNLRAPVRVARGACELFSVSRATVYRELAVTAAASRTHRRKRPLSDPAETSAFVGAASFGRERKPRFRGCRGCRGDRGQQCPHRRIRAGDCGAARRLAR
jgi:hypothetical protein